MQESSLTKYNAEFRASAIADEVIQCAIGIFPELEYNNYNTEALSSPLCDVLGWKFTRFGNSARNRVGMGFFDANGTIWQVKVFGTDPDGKRSGKYFAPKGKGDIVYYPPLPRFNVELIAAKHGIKPPLTTEDFWDWVLKHKKIRIVITEGGKKALCLVSASIVAVSFFGCSCGVDPQGDLKDSKLAELVKGREVAIAFDSDANPKTIRRVMASIHKLAKSIKRSGGKPFIAEWEHNEGKGIDDVAASHGYERVNAIVDRALTYIDWVERGQKIKLIEQYRRGRSFTPNQVVNIPKLPDGILDSALIYGSLTGVKAGMGTGKTYQLQQLAKQATLMGLRLIVVGYRNGLLRSFLVRLDEVGELAILLIDEDPIMTFSPEHLLLCHHSIGKLTPDRFENAIVVLDEAVSVIKDVLTTKLKGVGNRRREHIDKLQLCIANAHSVIALDATLNDLTIAAIRDLRSFRQIQLIENTFRLPMQIKVFEGTKKGRDLMVFDAVKLTMDEPILFTSNNKQTLKIFRQMLIDRGIEDRRILIVTQDTAGEEETIGFLACPDSFIAHNQPQVALMSPTGETGLDISTVYFAHHYHAHSTITDIDSAIQFLGRERNSITCYKSIWIEDRSKYSERGYGVISHCNYENLRTHAIAAVSGLGKQVTDLSGAYPMLSQFRDLEISHDIERRYFAELSIDRLTELGHNLTFVSVDEVDRIIVAQSALDRSVAREQVNIEDATGHLAADDSHLTRQGAAKILSRSTRLPERRAAEKFFFRETYPRLDRTEYWNTLDFWLRLKVTDVEILHQLERLYLLFNPKLAKTTTVKKLSELHHKGGILRDLDRLSVEAQAADLAGLGRLIGHTYCNSDSLLQEVVNKLSRCFGVFPKRGAQSNTQYLSQIAAKFGLSQVSQGRKKDCGQAKTYYTLKPKYQDDSLLLAVFDSISLRHKLAQGCHPSNPSSDQDVSSICTGKPTLKSDTPGYYDLISQGCHLSNPNTEREESNLDPLVIEELEGLVELIEERIDLAVIQVHTTSVKKWEFEVGDRVKVAEKSGMIKNRLERTTPKGSIWHKYEIDLGVEGSIWREDVAIERSTNSSRSDLGPHRSR